MSAKKSRSRQTYTPNLRTPTAEKDNNRVLTSILLLFLLPPVGLYYLWRNGVFRSRGRLIMTFISMAEMTLILFLCLPAQKSPNILPVPSIPTAATVVPGGQVVSALSNIDQLLADKQQAMAAENNITPEPTDQAAYLAEQEAILNTIVYSVYGNSAKYYHKDQICGTQTNRQELTVREAMAKNMGACPNCNPPIYTG